MSRLSKLGHCLSSSSASSSFAASSFSSSASSFKDRRSPTIPCRSFVPDCSPIRSPIRSAGIPSFTEVRTGSYLATRSSRALATATALAPAPSTRSRFLRAPPSESRGAAQQDPLDVCHSIMERARLRTQHIRSRYGLPERPRVDLRRQPRVEPASTPSVPTTRPTRFGERIRVLAEEVAAISAKHRASDSKLAAFDEVVARVRARKQSTTSAPSIDATRPVTRSERVQPSAPSVNATTRSSTRSEQARPSAPSTSDRRSELRAARAERRRWLDEMIAQQEARASAQAASAAAIEECRAKCQAPLANRSREGHLTSRIPVPSKSIRSTAIPAADLVRTRPSTSADRLRRDKPAKHVRFEEDVTVQTVSRWIVKNMHVHEPPLRRR